MEQRDVELIRKHAAEDKVLESLFAEHQDFERRLEKFNRKPFLTPAEEVERKTLQKLKLKGRDRIEGILSEYRRRQSGG
jgi:uncharacterized protein YdcH (DUF465 family)